MRIRFENIRYITQQHLLLYQAVFALFDGGYVVNFTPWLLYTWETSQYPVNRRQDGPQSWSGAFGEEKIPPSCYI
jgi:hypothetical protein